MTLTQDLLRLYPHMTNPMRCENGCGAVIEIAESYRSYKRGDDGLCLLICQCCAAEEGHRDEADEAPDESPVCRRTPKRKLRRLGEGAK